MRFFGFCLNWKVIAGLALVALGIWALAPGLIGAALPVLIVLACPLSMLFMMRGMRGMNGMNGMNGMGSADGMLDAQRALDSDYQFLGLAASPTYEDRMAELRAEMASIQTAQDAIARALAELEASKA